MLAAAHRLFVERGYAATSIRQVASEARVGEQTIYRLFETKPGLLREVLLRAVSGSDPGSTGREMKGFMSRVAAAETPAERLRIIGRWSGEAYERGAADLELVVFAAAAADPRVQELADAVRLLRYEDIRAMVAAVAGAAAPPPGVTLDEVADYIYAAWSSPVYRQLVGERGWTTQKFIDWSVRMVERLFLDDMSGGQGSRPKRTP